MPLTTIILTKNEARDLPRCLAALREWCAEIVVLDSGSDDATRELARAAGARVQLRAFTSFGDQRNWALDHCEIATPWVLFLDADEVATPAFRAAVARAIDAAPAAVAGFFCCWKTLAPDGTWLRRCDSFPKWQFRLLRRGRARFQDSGHGQKEGVVDGELRYVREPYEHHAFSKGWTHWLEKHNHYSSLEAAERLRVRPRWHDVFSRDGSRRNRALKPLLSRLPGWPLARFVHMFFLKRGFLEGRAGRDYCVNMAYYEFLIGLKMRELRRQPSSASAQESAVAGV
ncbi:MAG: glycosyltransferase family 2 protein [Verrucomicrobia bacterium]|nr:glycosyltransferase family 2 protein [Verrucomicrobiota bacterium]